jgi:hypothetical protein
VTTTDTPSNERVGTRQRLPVAGLVLLVALVLAALSYWGPWIDHQSAALKLSGQDLGEFVKFLPDIRRGKTRFPRQVFYLPPFACVVCLVLLSANRQMVYRRWLRLGTLVCALLLLPGLLPPASRL